MDYFVEHNENPQSRRVGDCVVRAISTALGQQWEARGSYDKDRYRDNSYDDGNSYANRGQHYVRGHYSRDEYSNDGYSERRDNRGRYSRDESKDMMMRKFDEMLGEAKTPAEREAIKKCIENMQDY